MKLTITYYCDFFNYPMGKKPSLENCKKCSLDGKPCDVMNDHSICGFGKNGYFSLTKAKGDVSVEKE